MGRVGPVVSQESTAMVNPRQILTAEFRDEFRGSVTRAVKIDSFADAVEKAMYLFAALIAAAFLVFLVYFMGVKVFAFFIAFFIFLVFAKGLFVLLIK